MRSLCVLRQNSQRALLALFAKEEGVRFRLFLSPARSALLPARPAPAGGCVVAAAQERGQ